MEEWFVSLNRTPLYYPSRILVRTFIHHPLSLLGPTRAFFSSLSMCGAEEAWITKNKSHGAFISHNDMSRSFTISPAHKNNVLSASVRGVDEFGQMPDQANEEVDPTCSLYPSALAPPLLILLPQASASFLFVGFIWCLIPPCCKSLSLDVNKGQRVPGREGRTENSWKVTLKKPGWRRRKLFDSCSFFPPSTLG